VEDDAAKSLKAANKEHAKVPPNPHPSALNPKLYTLHPNSYIPFHPECLNPGALNP